MSTEELLRYSRHLVLKGVGGSGQQSLKAARVLVVGAGGLGSPAIAYLAGAGVGAIGIVDGDKVATSNLQRQIVHSTALVGTSKAESAGLFVHALNPNVDVDVRPLQLTSDIASEVIADFDLVLDGTDNLLTRRIVAEACQLLQLPLISGAVSMFDGQVTVFAPGGPDFIDLYPAEADDSDLPSCELTGVLGPLTGIIGTLMAMEAVKIITGIGDTLIGRVLTYDGKGGRFFEHSLHASRTT